MSLKFNPETHTYTWNDKIVPSVTQVIGEWIRLKGTDYYVNVFTGTVIYADKFEAAGEIGRAIHKACAYIAKGVDVNMEVIDPTLVPPLGQFKKWMSDFKVKLLHVETPMYSTKYVFTGTPDILCEISENKNLIALVDIKTGLHNDMAGVQTAAYEILAREYLKIKKIIKRYELVLPRNGNNYKFIPLDNKDDYIFFLSCLNQFNFLRRIKK